MHVWFFYLSGAEIDKAVAAWLPLQRPRLMKQEVELFNFAKLFQKLYQMIPDRRKRQKKTLKRRKNLENKEKNPFLKVLIDTCIMIYLEETL